MNSTEDSTRSVFSDTASLTIIFYTLVLILSVIGNVVLSAVCLNPRLSRPSNFMLANLCMASLCQVFAMLSAILLKNYPIFSFGPWTCRLFPVIRACALPAEGFTVMCISSERSKVSIRPLERMSGRRAAKNILFVWLSSLIIEVPHGFAWEYADDAPSFRKCVNVINDW